ncbi:MAG: FAD-dependent monooxygenase [Cyclobacteriaceae bacterium]|nr:FAD-dependent monooxygenase [Cyclobacteriaceae bacterium]
MNKEINNITLIGAGLVGSLMAIYLKKRGFNVTIYERRSDMRNTGAAEGRSINLALSNRGLKPLQEVGLAKEVGKMVIPMNRRVMHDVKGNLTFQPYGKEGQFINSISRGGLNTLLMNKAEELGVKIIFDHRCVDINLDNTEVILEHNDIEKQIEADLIIGTDGAYSAVRAAMQKTDRFNYHQRYIDHGYKELRIPPSENGAFHIEKNALHIWPRGNYMLIALPNTDGSFTCTLFFPFEGEKSFETLKTNEEIMAFFNEQFSDAVPLMPTLLEDYNTNPASSLMTVKSFPWVRNKTLIIGDASHAIVPFYGQGMNSGFEDCRVLNDMLNEHKDNWDIVLPLFQKERKPDADAILELALRNFIEMRDSVGDENFLVRKKIEAKLHEQYPNKWIPLYSMVTFHEEMRYSEAIQKGEKQKDIMDKVMRQEGILENWKSVNLESIVNQLD